MYKSVSELTRRQNISPADMRMVISDLVGGIRQRFCLQLFYPVCPAVGIVVEAHFYGTHALGKSAETNLLRDEAECLVFMVPLAAIRNEQFAEIIDYFRDVLICRLFQSRLVARPVCIAQAKSEVALEREHGAEPTERFVSIAESCIVFQRKKSLCALCVFRRDRFAHEVKIHKALQRVIIEQSLAGRSRQFHLVNGAFGKRIGQVKGKQVVKRGIEAVARASVEPLFIRLTVVAPLSEIKQCCRCGNLRSLAAVITPTGDKNFIYAVFLANIKLKLA